MSRPGYEPYDPLNVPKPFARDLWLVDGPEIRFGAMGVAAPFPTRMTIVRLPDGRLWLHSPTAPDPALIEALERLGEVAFLVAPNTLHYWWISDWAERFPSATVYAAPGLDRSAKRPLPDHVVLEGAAPQEWGSALDQTIVRGPALTEAIFFHRSSRTLILTDLIENFEPARVRSPVYRAVLRLAGATDPDGKAPIDMRLSFAFRRKHARAAAAQMIAWAPERVVLAHGRCYRRDAVEELRRAFRWAL